MDRKEYLRLRAQLEERHRQDVAALDRVYERSSGMEVEPRRPQGRPGIERGRVDLLVRWALQRVQGDFGVREVQGQISAEHPNDAAQISRAAISSALLRLVDQELIELVERGVGRRQSVYRKREEPEPLPFGGFDDGMDRV